MVGYKSLASRPDPTPNGPLVDYRRNRFYQSGSTWVDNRSGLEQAIELLAYADCGFIGCSQGSISTSCVAATALNGAFGDPADGTVAEWLLGAMASKSPSTVSSLISIIDCSTASRSRWCATARAARSRRSAAARHVPT